MSDLSITTGTGSSRPPAGRAPGQTSAVRHAPGAHRSRSWPRQGQSPPPQPRSGLHGQSTGQGGQGVDHDRASMDAVTASTDRAAARPALIRRLGLISCALLGAVVVGVVVATFATPPLAAQAHTALASSSPAAGTQVSRPVTDIRLTFSAPIDTTSAVVTLAIDGAAPRPLTTDAQRRSLIAIIPADVIADGTRATAARPWTIAYQVVSADGHSIKDRLTFTVTAAQPGASAATSTPGPPQPSASTGPTSSASAASPPAAGPHENGVNPHGKVGPQRLFGPGLALGLIAMAALLVVVGPRLTGRPAPPKDAPPDGTDDHTGDGREAPGPASPTPQE